MLSHVGIRKFIKPSQHFTSLEHRYYDMLQELGIFYVPQYRLGGRYYDAYLPDFNLLLEFDGTFWHPLSIAECKYDHQLKNYGVDKLKNDIAKKNGMKLIRIREENPIELKEFNALIGGSK